MISLPSGAARLGLFEGLWAPRALAGRFGAAAAATATAAATAAAATAAVAIASVVSVARMHASLGERLLVFWGRSGVVF